MVVVERRKAVVAEEVIAAVADIIDSNSVIFLLGPKIWKWREVHMRRTKLNFDKFHWANLSKLAAVAILFAACFPARSMPQQPGQKTFSSPEDASNALLTAAQNNDEKAMLDILGPERKANRLVG